MACARCGCGIHQTEDIITLNKMWHKCCFTCYRCKKRLDKCSAKIFQGEVFCECCYNCLIEEIELLSPSSKPCRVISTPSCTCEKELYKPIKVLPPFDNSRKCIVCFKTKQMMRVAKSCSHIPDKKTSVNAKDLFCFAFPIPREVANYYNRVHMMSKQKPGTNCCCPKKLDQPPGCMKLRSLSQQPPCPVCRQPRPRSPRTCCQPPPCCTPSPCCCMRCFPPPPPPCCRRSSPARQEKCHCPKCCKIHSCPPRPCSPKRSPTKRKPCSQCCPDPNRKPCSQCCPDPNRKPCSQCCPDPNRKPCSQCCPDPNRKPCSQCCPDPNRKPCSQCCPDPNRKPCSQCCPETSRKPCSQCCPESNRKPECPKKPSYRCCPSHDRCPSPPNLCGKNRSFCECKMCQVRAICTPICNRCGFKVYAAEKISVTKGAYHSSCFSCFCCHKLLDVKNVYENCGEIYCRQCYNNLCGNQFYGYGSSQFC